MKGVRLFYERPPRVYAMQFTGIPADNNGYEVWAFVHEGVHALANSIMRTQDAGWTWTVLTSLQGERCLTDGDWVTRDVNNHIISVFSALEFKAKYAPEYQEKPE